MYHNIGGKIKIWAVWTFVVEAIAAIIGGIALISGREEAVGVLVIVFGPIVAWVGSWLLYGFGQLIENTDIIAAAYSRKGEKHEKIAAQNTQRRQSQIRQAAKVAIANPEVDEDAFVDVICPNCQAELSYPKGQLQSEEGVVCPMCDAHISA